MTLFWFIVGVLATWRITSILHHEEIAAPFRALLGVQEDEGLTSYPDTFLGHLIECFWCVSVWVAIGCTLILVWFPYLLLPFALSAGAIAIERVYEHGAV